MVTDNQVIFSDFPNGRPGVPLPREGRGIKDLKANFLLMILSKVI